MIKCQKKLQKCDRILEKTLQKCDKIPKKHRKNVKKIEKMLAKMWIRCIINMKENILVIGADRNGKVNFKKISRVEAK